MSQSVTKPINYISSILKQFSTGEGDLTKLEVKSKNEFGILSRYFNDFTDLKKLISKIKIQ